MYKQILDWTLSWHQECPNEKETQTFITFHINFLYTYLEIDYYMYVKKQKHLHYFVAC